VAVNYFLDPLEQSLQFEVAIVPLAIDKKIGVPFTPLRTQPEKSLCTRSQKPRL
jgi:hypothetical protein